MKRMGIVARREKQESSVKERSREIPLGENLGVCILCEWMEIGVK